MLPHTVKAHLPDGGEGECKPTLEIGDARLLAECIQKLGNGYVIEGKLAINGTLLVPKSGFLKIRTVSAPLGVGTKTELYGARSMSSCPTPRWARWCSASGTSKPNRSRSNSTLTVPPKFEGVLHDFRRQGTPAAGGTAAGAGARTPTGGATPKPPKTLLFVFGVGKNCKAGETNKAGCCPPPNGVSFVCAEIPGNFPITGLVDVYLTNTGKTLLYVQVGLNLKEVNLEATGALEIIVNNESGIELQSMKFEIGEAALKPIFKIKGASFQYYFPSYEEASKADTWQAKGTITFGEEVAQLKAEMAFKKGNFRSAAMSLKIKPGVPVFAGVFLNEIGASVGVEPLEFGGSLGASIAEVLEVELEFKFREQTEKELGFFGGEGRLSYKENKIASLAGDVYTDGYVDAALKVEIKLPFGSKEPLVELRGGVSFWDEPNAKPPEHEPEALLAGAGRSVLEDLDHRTRRPGAGQQRICRRLRRGQRLRRRWALPLQGQRRGRRLLRRQQLLRPAQGIQEQTAGPKHSGGFVKEERRAAAGVRQRSRRWRARLKAAAAAAGEGRTFALPEGTEGQELRVTSTSGSPVLRITGPGGQTYTTPGAPKQMASVAGQFIAALAPDPGQVLILLKHPKGGRWTIQPLPGSGPLGKLETAEDVPPASVHVHVHHARGRGYALEYRSPTTCRAPGPLRRTRPRQHAHDRHGEGGAGTAALHARGSAGARAPIYAYLLNVEGVEMRELPVGGYTAPDAFRPSAPRGVRIVRKRNTATVTWRPSRARAPTGSRSAAATGGWKPTS